MQILRKCIENKNVIEVGSNYGDITSQILEMKPKNLLATDINESRLDFLKKRFNNNKEVVIKKLDIFQNEKEYFEKYDTIILKEIINAFEIHYYNSILQNSIKYLTEGGSLIIIDYLPAIHLRQLFVRLLLSPFKFQRHFKRYFYNKKFKKQLNQEKLGHLFDNNNFKINYFKNVDPLNMSDRYLHKILEKIIPMKYLFIATKR